jgi:hypothetical protein
LGSFLIKKLGSPKKNFESCSKVIDQDNFDVLESSNTLVISYTIGEDILLIYGREHFQSPYKAVK